ncbi:alcohol dehydrogenase catalytic domain-containing protein [Lacticaseibacillus daqingensis]|uniref:alcohol dehydrogenase catalytic domain-containing protein n=1 Tax=Lacticaseibacillus daqingensis TaxID=2486014 RepID=UPI000F78BB97|nr:alcohol dehydrogenase catalytic domain-containing protein [Lacticaseibacillus daqingensis]
MKAIVFDQFGAPAVLHAVELPAPTLTPTTAIVRVEAVAVNHVDTFIRSGAFQTALATPHVVGRDLVGVVTAVGRDVTTVHVGQRVWTNSAGYEGRPGATSELVAVAADRLYPAPDRVAAPVLVAALHPGAPAAIVLSAVMQAKPGQRLLVEGAAGHVGRAFVTLAHHLGLTVATTSAAADRAQLAALGSTQWQDYHDPLPAAWRDTFDHVVDTSGRVALQANLDALRLGGAVTLITAPADDRFTFGVRAFYMAQKRLNGFVISHATAAQLAAAATVLNGAFARGQLLDAPLLVRPFEDAAWAHATLAAGTHHLGGWHPPPCAHRAGPQPS